MKFRKLISLMLVFSMILSFATACGKKTDDPDKDNKPATENNNNNSDSGNNSNTGSDSSNTASGPIEINVGYGTNWDTLTPFRSNIANNAPYAYILYESLACLDENRNNVPWAAKSWKTDDNGFTYDIEIYDYITDSAGNKITAADIVWMIEGAKTAAQKPSFSKVESVEQTGDYTLRVKMITDMVGAFDLLLRDTFVVSKAAYEASKDGFATDVVSTSPYKLIKYVSDSEIDFEKRDDYWQTDESLIPKRMVARVDKVNYHIIKEASQMGIALETGDIDIALEIDPNTGKQFEGNDDYTIQLSPQINGYQLYFTGAPNRPCGEDKNLRQAICYAIDADGIVTGALAGYGEAMHDVASNALIGYLEKWKTEEYYPYNVDKAKELLAQSDYNGEELVILATSSSIMQRICQMIQSYLAQVGINVKLNLVDMALYTASRLDGTQYDMTLNTVGGGDLPSMWSIRFDSAAYKTGDATSRHDTVLDELLYKTWTPDGWTEENIDAVHQYLKENMYAYGMAQPKVMGIYSKKVNMLEAVYTDRGAIEVTACKYAAK